MRGGERVLEWLARGFPSAPIYTLLHRRETISETLNSHPIHTSWIQRIPGIFEHYRWALPLFPSAVRGLRPDAGDMLISTSHCVAKAVRPAPGMKHLCYCFTPMRYAWTFQEEYLGRSSLKRALAAPILARLRQWDRRTASHVDLFVTLSRHVQDRILRFYGRDAAVVYPPVNVDYFTPGAEDAHGGYDLIVSALVPYKRVDLAVRAYSQLGYPLKIAGIGTESDALKRIAAPNVTLLGRCSDEAVRELYRGCRCLIFPGEEDFGIVPVEAQACGRPVVALARGGVVESVRDGQTGVFFARQTERDLLDAVSACAARRWNRETIRRHAEQFHPSAFIQGIARAIEHVLAGPKP